MAVILQAPFNLITTTTVLPNPQFADTEQGLNTLVLKKTIANTTITYVKRRDRQRLVWNFQLTLEKAWELRAFWQEYMKDQIRITDHNDEVWQGIFKSNPIEFTYRNVNQSNAECQYVFEMVNVVLELEATKLKAIYDRNKNDNIVLTEDHGVEIV